MILVCPGTKHEAENCARLGCYASSGNSWDSLPLKMGTIDCLETSVRTTRCVIAQKSAVLIYFAVEAWNDAKHKIREFGKEKKKLLFICRTALRLRASVLGYSTSSNDKYRLSLEWEAGKTTDRRRTYPRATLSTTNAMKAAVGSNPVPSGKKAPKNRLSNIKTNTSESVELRNWKDVCVYICVCACVQTHTT